MFQGGANKRIIDLAPLVAKQHPNFYDHGMIRPSTKPVVVAAGQIQSRLMNEAAATLEDIAELIREAVRERVQFLVLPECAYPAYLIGSVASYRTGDHLSSEQYLDWLGKRAAEHRMHIVSGYVEDTGEALFNSAILIGPDGRKIGQARKRFLWHVDQDWYQPGEEVKTFPTEIGRIGLLICAEARVPEIIATLTHQGAELIAMPTCWINNARQPGQFYNPQTDFLIEARAREFGVPFVCADKSGMEMTMGYVGQSCVVTPDGATVVKAPTIGQALVVSEITRRRGYLAGGSESRRARLLENQPAVLPARTSAAEITIAAVSTSFANQQFKGGMGESLFAPLQKVGVGLLVANMPQEAAAERLSMLSRAFDIESIAFPTRADLQTVAGARVGCMAGEWLNSFATGRTHALDGAEVLVYFDATDVAMLRTRAIENRVFVVGVSNDSSIIVGPDSTVLARGCGATPAVARVDLAQASNKLVAPRTDIFAQRRPGMYRF